MAEPGLDMDDPKVVTYLALFQAYIETPREIRNHLLVDELRRDALAELLEARGVDLTG